MDIRRYFSILFLNKNISRANLKQFTEDHIQRLTANNPGGIFTTLIANVTNAYTAFFGDLGDVSVAEAFAQARTAGMNAAKDAMIQFIRDSHGLVVFTFRSSPEVVQEFYPQGLDEYNHADLGEIETKVNRYITAATAHVGALPAGFVTEITDLKNTFVSNRTAQLTQKGTLSGEREQISGTQEALCIELTKSVLTIALQFVGQEIMAHAYFDQSIIDPDHAAKVLKEVTLNIAAHETVNIEITGFVMEPEYLIIATNPTTSSVAAISFGPNATTLANAKTINAGSTYSASAADTEFSATNTFLNLRSETDDPVSGLVVKIMKP